MAMLLDPRTQESSGPKPGPDVNERNAYASSGAAFPPGGVSSAKQFKSPDERKPIQYVPAVSGVGAVRGNLAHTVAFAAGGVNLVAGPFATNRCGCQLSGRTWLVGACEQNADVLLAEDGDDVVA